MKTFDKKDVFSWANCNELRLATHGYVGNSLSDLACNIAPEGKVVLLSIDENSALCFTVENNQDNLAKVYHFAFFLPADKVKEVEEKKWRAFTLEEFLNKFSIGTKISFRRKDETRSVYGLFEGYQTDVERIIKYQIIICNLWYTLKELFENYEYLDEHGDWHLLEF